MATNNSRPRSRWGICLNDSCQKSKDKELQEVGGRKEFLCAECGKPLKETRPPKSAWDKYGKIAIIGAAVVVVCGGVAAYFMTADGTPTIESLTLNSSSQNMIVGDQNTLIVTNNPIDAPATYVWSTSNPAVLEVSNGQVTAIAPGEATVTVVANENGDAIAVCQYVVESPVVEIPVEVVDEVAEKPATPQPVTGDSGNTPGKVNLGYATYDGPRQNGKPHGMGGTLTFTSSYQLDLKKMPAEYVNLNKGDYITNTKFINGRLVQGQIHFTNGSQKWINI